MFSRIKTLIKGRDAFIVPGVLQQDDLYLSDLLGKVHFCRSGDCSTPVAIAVGMTVDFALNIVHFQVRFFASIQFQQLAF